MDEARFADYVRLLLVRGRLFAKASAHGIVQELVKGAAVTG